MTVKKNRRRNRKENQQTEPKIKTEAESSHGAGNDAEKSRRHKFHPSNIRRISLRKKAFAAMMILDLIIILVFTTGFYRMHRKLEQLNYEISYLSDNNQVLINSVNDMRSDIESTLEEEASFLESWDIQLKNMNFADNTYTVAVQVVPKEYTENTQATIYFGTRDFPLELNGYCFIGEAELTLDEAYDGNVTVLFVDGSSRKTEVLSDYSDVRTDLTNVLYGEIYDDPEYEDGNLMIDGTGYVELDGGDFFMFDSLHLVIEADGQEVTSYDLAAMASGSSAEEAENAYAASGAASDADGSSFADNLTSEGIRADLFGSSSDSANQSDQLSEDSTEETEKTRNHTTMPTSWLSYTYTINDSVPVTPGCHVRIYLKAVTENGYTFTYDLFSCDIDVDQDVSGTGDRSSTAADQQDSDSTASGQQTDAVDAADLTGTMNPDSIDLTNYASVYDPKGGCYKIR